MWWVAKATTAEAAAAQSQAAVDDDDEYDDKQKVDAAAVAAAADGVDCAPVKCKLHISQKMKKSNRKQKKKRKQKNCKKFNENNRKKKNTNTGCTENLSGLSAASSLSWMKAWRYYLTTIIYTTFIHTGIQPGETRFGQQVSDASLWSSKMELEFKLSICCVCLSVCLHACLSVCLSVALYLAGGMCTFSWGLFSSAINKYTISIRECIIISKKWDLYCDR